MKSKPLTGDALIRSVAETKMLISTLRLQNQNLRDADRRREEEIVRCAQATLNRAEAI